MSYPNCACGYNGEISTCMCLEAVSRRKANLEAGRREHDGFMAFVAHLDDPNVPAAVVDAVRRSC